MINRLLDHGEEFAEAMRKRMEEEGEEVENTEAPEPTETRTDGGAQDDTQDTEAETYDSHDNLTGLEGFDEGDEERNAGADEKDQRLNAMENRVEDVEDGVDEVRSSLRTMEEKQDEVSESIDEIDERMRQLVGIYDEVTSESNPFSDDVPEDGEEDRFGVVPGEADAVSVEQEESHVVEEEEKEDARNAGEEDETPEEEVTSYDDLTKEVPGDKEVVENVVEESHGETDEPAEIPRNGGADVEDKAVPTNGFGKESAADGIERDIGDHPLPSGDDEEPFLDGFEPSYAADIIVMEWMSVMTVRADPAGAFKALDYYESIGWISSDVRDYLETVVGGPGVDSHVNPGDVESPAIRDHKMSHSYIRQLKEITEM